MWSVIGLLFFLSVCGARPASLADDHDHHGCGRVHLDRCLQPITDVTGDERLSFPVTGDDLAESCRRLEAGDRCTQRYIRRCMAPSTVGMVADMIGGAKHVLRLLCHNRTVQDDYLRHARCFKRVAFLNQCAHGMIFDAEFTPPPNDPNAAVLRQFCCRYKSNIECQLDGIRSLCHRPTEAAQFFQRYTHQISHLLLTEHCLSFTQTCYTSAAGYLAIFLAPFSWILQFIIGAFVYLL